MVSLSDLSHLPRPGSGQENSDLFRSECWRHGLIWPSLVIDQFLFDHGNKLEFMEQYGDLDLASLSWELEALHASELVSSTYYDDFGERVRSVASHPDWTLTQYSTFYGEVWDGSWRTPPVFIAGSLRHPPQRELHLVEGHTRLGVLIGLVARGDVAPDSIHQAFVASPPSGAA